MKDGSAAQPQSSSFDPVFFTRHIMHRDGTSCAQNDTKRHKTARTAHSSAHGNRFSAPTQNETRTASRSAGSSTSNSEACWKPNIPANTQDGNTSRRVLYAVTASLKD